MFRSHRYGLISFIGTTAIVLFCFFGGVPSSAADSAGIINATKLEDDASKNGSSANISVSTTEATTVKPTVVKLTTTQSVNESISIATTEPAQNGSSTEANATFVDTGNVTSTASPTAKPQLCDEAGRSYFMLPVYVIVCIYSFLGIAIICHKYFLPSLSRICEELKMSEDVVGATFMAAGSSAPELATVIIAVFITKNDIGISDVIGSALFNMLFVIALCSFLNTGTARLNWWPLCRNCLFYLFSILLLLLAIYDGKVTWFESVLLLVMYVLYCIALYYNVLLEAWVYTLPLPFNKLIVSDGGDEEANKEQRNCNDVLPLQETKQPVYDSAANRTPDNNVIESPKNEVTSTDPTKLPAENSTDDLAPDASTLEKIKWYILYPINLLCRTTIPNCQQKQWQNYYIITFFMSMVWISLYSYVLIQMISLTGETLNIADTVMGLTLLAAGVSVPDAITSIDVVRKGYGDMGISNAVGSNIFDVLVCLGLPWFLKTVLINPGEYVSVQSIGMLYSTVLLFSSVALLLVTAYCNKWQLNKVFGVVLMFGYFIFIGISVTLELLKGAIPTNCISTSTF